jgi:hypothetical protein
MNKKWLLLSLLFLVLFVTSPNAEEKEVYRISPGRNIQSIVRKASEGASFYFEPGVYRLQRITPKNRQRFIGERGVVFNGALLLRRWRREGDVWVATGRKKYLPGKGHCRASGDLCKYREDLFVDNKLYRRSRSLDDLKASKWFEHKWYAKGRRIYLVDDPTRRKIELSVTPNAFIGKASGILIKDIVVEKYASAAQEGAIEFLQGADWRLINVVARWNHGVGARIGPGAQLTGGSYSYNGQLGIGGGYGAGILIENTEIAFNNYAGFSEGWEAGGTKFVKTDGLIVRNSCVHHNDGPGLWTDIDNINVLFARNKVFENTGDGIKHEISYKAVIRDNVVVRNGSGHDIWFWGSQILVQNSRDVEVFQNTVQIDRTYGNGISIVQQKRGEGAFGPRISSNNHIHDNLVIYLGEQGRSGMAADHDAVRFKAEGKNIFDSNTYIVPAEAQKFIEVEGRKRDWDELQAKDYEVNGTRQIGTSLPLQLSCD